MQTPVNRGVPHGLRAINPRADKPVTLRNAEREVKCKRQLWATEDTDETPMQSPERPLASSTPRSHLNKKKPLLDTSRCDFTAIIAVVVAIAVVIVAIVWYNSIVQ